MHTTADGSLLAHSTVLLCCYSFLFCLQLMTLLCSLRIGMVDTTTLVTHLHKTTPITHLHKTTHHASTRLNHKLSNSNWLI
ncbi:hypothetical protein ACQKWADRAFT_276575 [Trichoderma austrokoningii]